MYVLILTACLAAQPGVCADRLLPAGSAPDRPACEARGAQVARDWLAVHDDLRGGKVACALLTDAPALTLENPAPGVFVHRGADEALSPANRGGIANLSLIVGTDQVAVIDPGGARAEGEALFTALRRLTDLPIGPVILTHMHPDHIAGAEVFAEAGGEIIADARLPAALDARRATWMDSIPSQIGAEAWLGTRLIGPARTVAGGEQVDLGGTALTLTSVAAAHTDTDMSVRDSRSGALFTGDLVFRRLTPVVDGSLLGWLAWLAAPVEDSALVVPGHGPLAASLPEAAGDQTRYLSALRGAVRASLDAGQGLSAAVPAILAAMAGMRGVWADFDATTARNAAAAFAEMEWE